MVMPIFTKIIFYLLLIILIQHTESLLKYMKHCTSDEYCQSESGLICKSSICVCVTYYNFTSHKCEEPRCSTQLDCFTNDKYSMCMNGRCVCNDTYVLSSNGKCTNITASVNKPCSYSIDCSLSERCVDSICRCHPDYHFNTTTKKCQYFNCVTSHINCSTPYDPYRECSPGRRSCVCRLLSSPYNVSNLVPGQQNSYNGNKCYYKIPVHLNNGSFIFIGLFNRYKSSNVRYSGGIGGVGGVGGGGGKGWGKSSIGGSAKGVTGGAGFFAGIGAFFKKLCAKCRKKKNDNKIDNV